MTTSNATPTTISAVEEKVHSNISFSSFNLS
jgi:hypothetical protein